MTSTTTIPSSTRSDERVPRGSVIVAHPGTQHSYQTALALQEADLLDRYLTGVYYKPEARLARLVENMPGRFTTELRRQLRRRYLPGLEEVNIQTHALAELLYVGCTHFKPLRQYATRIQTWRNDRFDQWTANLLRKREPKAVVCYDSSSIRTFREAKSIGAVCILDQSIADIRTGLKILREEVEAQPDFADSMDTALMDALEQRCAAEPEAADVILAGSTFVKGCLQENGVSPAKIVVVPYGADIDVFAPEPRKVDGPFRILFVGQLSQRKGIKYLLEAVRQLRLPRCELTLVGGIVGSGEGLIPYRSNFKWIPNVPHHEVHHQFTNADIFVYPSLFEGSAIAIYEALASGLPVITTPNSGSVVRDGMEGFVLPIRDVDALKEKILLLYTDLELRQMMSRAARKRARQFTWAAYRERIGAVVRQAMQASTFRAAV